MYSRAEPSYQPRVELNAQMIKDFFEKVFRGTVSELATAKGLSYALVYNLVHGRIHSLSARDYRIIFGEEPPRHAAKRVDGEFFRQMVRLWLFLNEGLTEADLYREFYKGKDFKRVDYRIFSGDIRTVEVRIEKLMEGKFSDQGLDSLLTKKWIRELEQVNDEERVSFEEIKPILDYLAGALGVHPSRILNQWLLRYETGELKTVPSKVYNHALKLKGRAEEAVRTGSRFEIERLREEIYGKREGFTLYSEVEDELQFLKRYAGKSPNQYLGRSHSAYKKSKLKRVASWRARWIKEDFNALIKEKPQLPLQSVPKSYLKKMVWELISVLKVYATLHLIKDETRSYEKFLLTPSRYSKEEYDKMEYGFTMMDKASHALGMSKTAFDYLVMAHSDLFRTIGIYDEKWYLPNLYLKEMLETRGFDLIIAKYEFLAKECATLGGLKSFPSH